MNVPAPPNAEVVAPEKSRIDLEWPRLVDALAARCETVLGAELARALGPPSDPAEVRVTIDEVAEAMRTAVEGDPLPVPALRDLRDAHSRAEHAGVLAPAELRAIAELLAAARTLRRFLHARRRDLPTLFASCSTDPVLDAVEDEIASAFDPDGTLADRASPTLKALRGEYAANRARMITRIEELMRRYAHVLQDAYWTEREGRYVLPVRCDSHERFPGIVHAASGSGATLFVEPRVLIPLGNRLKMLEGEVRREEEAVYARLTARVVDVIASLRGAIDAMARADLRSASARLARDLNLRFPDVPPPGDVSFFRADLRALRHPLLVLESVVAGASPTAAGPREVVPSDVVVEEAHALVISGPNAGGKTVALKALGLSSLMLRCGLPIAAAEGSRLGLIETVLTDIGDDQSLQKSLSSFSAHVTNLVSILDAARPGALVLLDELAGGTDPREGEALAAAILDGLCRRGAAVVATTHYEGLKALALADRRFQNASVGFDEATLSPTFRLALGVPGASSALSVARRFGVPSLVIDRAHAYLSDEDRSFEETVRRLNDERRALELARAAAEAEAAEARTVKVRLEAELNAVRARDRRVVTHEAELLLAAVRRARDEVRSAQARVRGSRGDPEAVRDADRTLDAVARTLALGGELSPLVERDDPREARSERIPDDVPLRKGAKVYVPRLRAEAEVVDVQGDGQLRVAAGAMKLILPRAEVRVLVDGPREGGPRGARTATRAPRLKSSHSRGAVAPVLRPVEPVPMDPEVAIPTADNSVDVRGLRLDDAWPMVETFIDRALNRGSRLVFVIHGHGSGALREKVREELRRSRYVGRLRAGNPSEGGDGVTVAWLAD